MATIYHYSISLFLTKTSNLIILCFKRIFSSVFTVRIKNKISAINCRIGLISMSIRDSIYYNKFVHISSVFNIFICHKSESGTYKLRLEFGELLCDPRCRFALKPRGAIQGLFFEKRPKNRDCRSVALFLDLNLP